MKTVPMYVAVKALICEDEKLLLLKKRTPVFWDLPGGRIDYGEHIIEALQRELAEELPDFKDYQVDSIIGTRKKETPLSDGNELFLTYFLVHSTSNKNTFTLSHEHTDHKFFSLDQINQLEFPLNGVYSGLFKRVFNQNNNEQELNTDSLII